MKKYRMLDLFAGSGGSAQGYAQAGFEVVGVDLAPMPRYPYEFHVADALTFPLAGFDCYHASPVCQGYTELNSTGKEHHAKLIPAIRERLQATGKPFIIENVDGARSELPGSITLCGSMFGLGVQRHRLFESNVLLFAPGHCRHGKGCISVHGHSIWDSSLRGTTRKDGRVRPGIVSFEAGCEAMQINWMTQEELTQAIPPAYTYELGRQLLAYLESEAA